MINMPALNGTPQQGQYLDVTFRIYMRTPSSNEPIRFILGTGDTRFYDANGEKPGLMHQVSPDPVSADYDPSDYNRIARAYRDAGFAYPDEVPLARRHLRSRLPSLLAAYTNAA